MEITFTLSQIVAICTTLTAIITAYKLVSKPAKDRKERDDKIDKLLDNDKKRLDKLDEVLQDIETTLTFQSDMIYQILDHLATHNNSGGMKRVMDEYNAHFRKNL